MASGDPKNIRSDETEELLDLLLQKEGFAVSKAITIGTRTDKNEFPLSFGQQRLWFLYQLELESPFYNMSSAVRLTGNLDIIALTRSLDSIVNRHEVLRANFTTVEGLPLQTVVPSRPVRLPIVDIQELEPDNQERCVQQRVSDEAGHPFDLEHDPLIRFKLLMLAEQQHVMLVTMHHIVSDGWSMGILIEELASLYDAFSSGKDLPLKEPIIQYADYALWQRERFKGEFLGQQMDYWCNHLKEMPQVMDLPTDRSRPAIQRFKGDRYFFSLSTSLTGALHALSQEEGVTLFMALLTGVNVLLQHYTRQSDIIVGTPIAGRTQPETETLIGFFVNTLVLRVDGSGNPTLRELLQRVKEVTLDAYAHQELPFEKLVEELHPSRTLSYNPLFQVMLAHSNTPHSPLSISGLLLEQLDVDSGTSHFDITLSTFETPQGLSITVEYDTDLFDRSTIEQMMSHFQCILAALVADPSQYISQVDIITPSERQKILVDWNTTFQDYPREACVHQLFEAQVERTPEAVAVVFENQQLTYCELNDRANQVAHHLQALGVGPDVLVGICVERSLEMIIGLLGILKAGGAYVPLDPSYPVARLRHMLADMATPVVLSQNKWFERLTQAIQTAPNIASPTLVGLDADWLTVRRESRTNPTSGVIAANLAYVMYTSGSTGNPKGVMVPHSALVNVLTFYGTMSNFADHDILAAVTTLSFDIAQVELHLPLMYGARLLLVSQQTALDNVDLASWLEICCVTFMQATPATWRLLLEGGWRGTNQIKVVMGGEAMPRELAYSLLKQGASLWNVYGPTETTVWSTFHPVNLNETSVPIGRPIFNTQIYLLDEYMQPVPIGVSGELYVGGAGVARGYLHRPAFTAERFIPDPWAIQPGDRLYKTGDLARYRTDGNIEFLGRVDTQVKIRGFRIELGEIETVLGQHVDVQEAVVLEREKQLVAYVVPRRERQPFLRELRQYLQVWLPDHMIPTVFVWLTEMPLTSNGKVDRKALPAPSPVRPALVDSFIAPRTDVEARLASIWADVLKLDQVGIQDNFFELGGHSLIATQVMARIRHVFQVELSLRLLFQSPTVAELASLLEQCQGNQGKSAAIIKRISQQSAIDLMEKIDQLSDQEIDGLLENMSYSDDDSE